MSLCQHLPVRACQLCMGAVFLNAEMIGRNCTFYQGVTLGTAAKGRSGRPVLEDNVVVYTGAVVVGNITLHEGCIIGANSVVTHDVEAYTLVGGVPAKPIKSLNRTEYND